LANSKKFEDTQQNQRRKKHVQGTKIAKPMWTARRRAIKHKKKHTRQEKRMCHGQNSVVYGHAVINIMGI
jgi:hypothetical protein